MHFLLAVWTMMGLWWSPSSSAFQPTTKTRRSPSIGNAHNDDGIIKCDVLVLGAGAAGIAAARKLPDQHVIVLEARNRVGGRAHTSDALGVGVALDHGAKWLHGASGQNRMVQLLEDDDHTIQRIPSFAPLSDSSESQSSETVDDVAEMDPSKTVTRLLLPTSHRVVASEPSPLAQSVAHEIFAQVMEVFDNPPLRNNLPDKTLQEVLQLNGPSFWETHPAFICALQSHPQPDDFQTQVEALVNLEICQFFDNWEGAPIDRVSALHGLEGTILDGGNALLSGGYGNLVQQLAAPMDEAIRLNHEIESVQTFDEMVRVRCRVDGKPKVFQAPACIVALPLGVLKYCLPQEKSPQIHFEPPLPPSLCTSIENLGVAVMNKVELSFSHAWWEPGMERFTLACAHLNQGPAYHPWTSFIVEAASEDTNILVCYLHGDFAQETELKSNDAIQKECMEVLRTANLSSTTFIPDPSSMHVTRWYQDPHSRGSWTYYAQDSGAKDARNFRENAECHARGLYFCGEHTCDGSIPGLDLGCVHGAWLSGELAAAAVLERTEGSDRIEVFEKEVAS